MVAWLWTLHTTAMLAPPQQLQQPMWRTSGRSWQPFRAFPKSLLSAAAGSGGHATTCRSTCSWRRAARAARGAVCSLPQLTDLAHTLETLGRELPHPRGRLVLRPIEPPDCKPATVLLTRAFATTGYLPLDDAGQYCQDMLAQPPNGVLIVARLYTDDVELLPEGQDSRLIGTVALSFDRNTREEFPTLQPPDQGVYLSNMAVDPSFRRQGMARLLLRAGEELCAARGFREIYLHARLVDTPALQLYTSSGYTEVERDSFLVRLRNIMPRALMRKEVGGAVGTAARQ